MKNLKEYVFDFLDSKISDKDKIAIGFSGGVDSSALLHMIYIYKETKQKKFNIDAVFFLHDDEKLGKSDDMLLGFCMKKCKEYGIPLRVEKADLSLSNKQSAESAGHLIRKNFYKNSDYDYVFLGHHQDDQVETILIQLFRGAGVGMRGMLEFDGKVCRPMIGFKKDEIREYLKNNDISFHEDELNYDTSYTRNFWRHNIIPKIKEHYPTLNQKILLFSEKQKEQNVLMHDLAISDGLNDLLENKSVSFDSKSNLRLKNLLSFYLKEKMNKSLQEKQWKEIEKNLLFNNTQKSNVVIKVIPNLEICFNRKANTFSCNYIQSNLTKSFKI